MNLININETNKELVEIYHQLRDKAFVSDNSFIADSPKVVNILLQTNIKIKSILATHEYYKECEDLILTKNIDNLFVLSKKDMEKIIGHKIHHNCMMHGIRPEQTSLDNLDDNIIMLDEISSSENVGSIARSAAALGIKSFLVPKTAPHPYSRRALRVSMGHVSKLKYLIYGDIFETIKLLKKNDYKVFGAEVVDTSINLQDVNVPKKWVLLMGHEGKGLSKELLDICDYTVKIEMESDVRSFNVAVASSIMMYVMKTQFTNSYNT
ncbi:MAG: rRNA methyltransferase [Sulfurimonas sp.]|nr:MAG: rRNA methyltransferase [Sulfurimonas sp.]